MAQTIRRTAVIGTSVALLSAGLLGSAVAGTHGQQGTHGEQGTHGAKLVQTHLTLHATHSTVSKTDHYKASVTGLLRAHKNPLANESVSVEQRTGKGHVWTTTGQSSMTDASGKVTFAFVQAATKEQYRLVFAGDTTYRKSHSGTITITRIKPTPTPTPTTTETPTPQA